MDLGKMVDVAIGLSLMFLMLSLFCTIINESINGFFDLRSRTLKAGLWRLAETGPEFLEILAHPSIATTTLDPADVAKHLQKANAAAAGTPAGSPQQLTVNRIKDVATSLDALTGGKAQNQQSYLSGRAFAAAVLDTINPTVQLTDTETYAAIMNAVANLPDSHLKQVLRCTVNTTTADVAAVRNGVAQWFDDEMERVQGVYKRWQQVLAFGVGLLLAVALNADALHVGRVLWQDHNLASQLADAAGKMLESDQGKALTAADTDVGTTWNAYAQASDAQSAAQKAFDATGADAKAALDAAIAATRTAKAAYDAAIKTRSTLVPAVAGSVDGIRDALAPLPIGWSDGGIAAWASALVAGKDKALGAAWVQLAGLLLTAMALALGAPFWFDTLGKVVNLRSAGAKPAPTTPSS